LAIIQLVVSTLGLLWFIFGDNSIAIKRMTPIKQTNLQIGVIKQPIQNQKAGVQWIYRGRDNYYYYYSDISNTYLCRVNIVTGAVDYKI